MYVCISLPYSYAFRLLQVAIVRQYKLQSLQQHTNSDILVSDIACENTVDV
jgi:hypothetical protein